MSLILTLLVLALLLFFLEIFAPGGILALIGVVLIFGAAGLAFNEWGLFASILIVSGGVLGGFILFFLEIHLLTNTRFGRQIALQNTVSARLNPRADEKLIGAEGVTLTILAPGGKVDVDGRVFTASAENGYLEKGVPVKVLRSETFKLIVQRI